MSAIGFVLVSTAPGQESEVHKALQEVPNIVELHPLFGEYDLIAKVEANDFDALGQAILTKFRSVPGVLHTRTLTVAKL
jgi:DNA-binding Lrp family transcriptional regulator